MSSRNIQNGSGNAITIKSKARVAERNLHRS